MCSSAFKTVVQELNEYSELIPVSEAFCTQHQYAGPSGLLSQTARVLQLQVYEKSPISLPVL